MTPIQPSAEVEARRRASAARRGQTIFSSTPRPANVQTTDSIGMPHAQPSVTRQNGVYVPAISTKIIAWSTRIMTPRSLRDQRTTWYEALVA